MAFVKRRINFISMVAAGLLLLSGLLFSYFVLSPRPAASASTGSSANSGRALCADEPGLGPAQYRQVSRQNLVNSWGLVHSPTSPWWVADNGKNVSTVYNGNGTPVNPLGGSSPLVVNIPAPGGGLGGTPTGIVFNRRVDHEIQVTLSSAQAASLALAFSCLRPKTARSPVGILGSMQRMLSLQWIARPLVSGAVYKGLAIGRADGKNFIYAANFRFGTVEIFDAHFKLVKSFTDKKLANDCPFPNQCFAPFGIRNIGGRLYVTYALQDAAHHDDHADQAMGLSMSSIPRDICCAGLLPRARSTLPGVSPSLPAILVLSVTTCWWAISAMGISMSSIRKLVPSSVNSQIRRVIQSPLMACGA